MRMDWTYLSLCNTSVYRPVLFFSFTLLCLCYCCCCGCYKLVFFFFFSALCFKCHERFSQTCTIIINEILNHAKTLHASYFRWYIDTIFFFILCSRKTSSLFPVLRFNKILCHPWSTLIGTKNTKNGKIFRSSSLTKRDWQIKLTLFSLTLKSKKKNQPDTHTGEPISIKRNTKQENFE